MSYKKEELFFGAVLKGVVEQLVLLLKGFKDAKPTKMPQDLGLEHFQAL